MTEDIEIIQVPQDEVYTTSEAQEILGLKHSAFYREVENAEVTRYPKTKRTYYYNKSQIDDLARHLTTQIRRVGRPAQTHAEKKKFEEIITSENAVIRPITQEDIGAVYHLQYEQLGYENAVQPSSMRKWVRDNVPIYWVAHNPKNSKDIWAVLGVIPLDEEIIIRFLREEFTLEEIAISAVLSYQPRLNYACYISVAAEPSKKHSLIQLMEYLLSYWCQQYPNISIRILYASSPIGKEETPLIRMLQTFSFSRRRDISTNKGIWELPLNEYNIAPAIQKFQKCIEEKDMLVLEKVSIRSEEEAKPPFDAPLEYRRAKTKDDVAAMVQIGAEIFLPPGVEPSISNKHQTDVWYSWLMKNPEIFNVVTIHNEIIGYISMIPLPQNIIDNIMRGAHPTTITPDNVLMFDPGQPLSVYVHIWGTTPRLTLLQKRYASIKMMRELKRTFYNFAQRGVDIRTIYTRSDKEDGIGISEHIGFEDIEVPGVTDAEPANRKHVFRIDTASSEEDFFVQYRTLLANYQKSRKTSVSESNN